jgi:hypothetical protein
MTKLATLKEMQADGWTLTTINGVKCLRKNDFGYMFIAQWQKNNENFEVGAMLDVIEKLGRPFKIHTLNGRVQTLEYFVA